MTDYKLFVPFILRWEGGHSNDKADKGGETNKGITWSTYQSLAEKVLVVTPTKQNFLVMTDSQAGLFIKYFWDKSTNGNTIKSQKVAEALTGWMWGSGPKIFTWFKKKLNAAYSGKLSTSAVIDDQAAAFINKLNADQLFKNMVAWREEYFRSIVANDPAQGKFLKGWLNRLGDFAKRNDKAIKVGGAGLLAAIGLILLYNSSK